MRPGRPTSAYGGERGDHPSAVGILAVAYPSKLSGCGLPHADFAVASSSIDNATNGSPGAYPSIYQGCHWGDCSSGGLSSDPIEVSNLTTGAATTSWSTTQTGSGAYDVAYDIWLNQTPTTTGQPNGTEIMVWLNHNGSVRPFGSEVATNVSIGGDTYDVWYGAQSSWDTVTYEMTSPATSVSNLDIGTLAQDSVSRGYTKSSWYLIDVEAGFELWQGGAGLATSSFSVTVNGGSSTPPPPPPPSSGCSAAYSVVNSWPGGSGAKVAVTNTGSGTPLILGAFARPCPTVGYGRRPCAGASGGRRFLAGLAPQSASSASESSAGCERRSH